MRDLRRIWQGTGLERSGILTVSFKACFCAGNGFNPAMDDLSIGLKLTGETKQSFKFAPNFI